jgi:hypothetical protein
MKTNDILKGLLPLLFLLYGCNDFLDREPWDAIDPDKNFRNAEEAIASVNGAYQPLQWAKLYNMRIWSLDIMAGNSVVGAGGGTDGIETQDLANFIAMPDNAGVLDIWRGPAPGILRCNFVLKNVPAMNIDENLKNRCIGEAKFLRAHYYFILVRLFGDVPLTVEPQDTDDNLKPFRAPRDSVYRLIKSDLEDAVRLLPPASAYTASDLGRASRGAAMGMLAKVFLTLGENYERIVRLCDSIQALGYRLNDDYSDNFDPNKKNGQESLFEVQYYGKTKYDFWSNENQASWLSAFTGPRNAGFVAGGYGWNQPSAEFVRQYEAGDRRKEKTVLYAGCPTFDGKHYQSSYSSTGYNLRKFLVPKSLSIDYNTSPANFVVLRYADVLLMKAEALNELGRTPEAEAPLYEVRKRAGLTDRSAIEGKKQAEMRELILKERRIELAFEGDRWFDLVRIDGGRYALNFLHSIGKINASEKHLLLPIPQKEREANENLTQNPGY